MKFKQALCLLLLFAALVPDAQAQSRNSATRSGASNRIALVIGNDSYRHISTLRNARADARAIGTALTNSGFSVTVLIDADEKAMKAALRTFKARISGGDEAVFYYSGHGVQLAGTNYLLPVDLRGDSEEQLKDDAVSLQRVLDDLQDQKARFSLAIIDACRDNPFRQAGRAIGGRGLASTNPATGQMVIYSAGTGQQALDRVGGNDTSPNGLFTRVFLREMEKPGVSVDRVLRGVRDEVVRLARAVGHDQVPALYDQALGEFYFRPGSAALVAPVIPQADPRADDRALWESVKDSSNPVELQVYLDQYPNGIFAGVVRARLKTLAQPRPPVQVAVAPPTITTTRPDTSAPLADLTPGSTFRDCDACPEMVVIPPGSFTMGSPASEQGRFDSESPQRSVNIARALAVGKYEVTRGEYAQFVQETARTSNGCYAFKDGKFQEDAAASWRAPGFAQNDSHPVACVNWDDAKAYVAWLARKSGKSYRLLSEAEWEYAARAGTSTAYYWSDNTANNCQYANGADQSLKTASVMPATWTYAACADNHSYTAPVGSFQPNAFGLHDMSGNVWEWTEDCWNANYNVASSDSSARTSGECGQRVVRGGAWDFSPHDLRSAVRGRFTSGFRYRSFGLRVARTF